MKSDEVGTTLKHLESFHGNAKNLSKMMEMKDKGECHFYFKNLTLPLGSIQEVSREHQGAPCEYLESIVPHKTIRNSKKKRKKRKP